MAEKSKQESVQLDMRNRKVSPLDSRSNSSVGENNVTPQVDKGSSGHDGESLLHNLAKAGNVLELIGAIDTTEVDLPDPNGNTFLHVLAERPSCLTDFFQRVFIEGKIDFVQELLTKANIDNQTFLAVAISNVTNKEMETDVIKLMDIISETCMEEPVGTLFQHKDEGGNNLLHLTVDKSLKELVCNLLTRRKELSKERNLDGHNPFHRALFKNNTEIISCFLEIVESTMGLVHDRMPNKETALHLAAKSGNTQIVKELIRHGGDLAVQDEDGHTPLHDCLQQVHYEGGSEDKEKCEKFIRVWNTIVEEVMTWWCLKHSEFKGLNGSKRYNSCQQKAVYHLRSCILNQNNESVLDYAAVMGLIPCVQAMLVTKDVFVVKKRMLSVDSHTKCDNLCCKCCGGKPQSESSSLYIDVTNLSPEYYVGDRSGADWNLSSENTRRRSFAPVLCFNPRLDLLQKSNKTAEILEAIPMLSVARFQWRVVQWFWVFSLILHLTVMITVTTLTVTNPDELLRFNSSSESWSPSYEHYFFIYSVLIITVYIYIKRGISTILNYGSRGTIDDKLEKEDNGVLNVIKTVINCFLDEGILKGIFCATALASSLLHADGSLEIYAAIKGYSLLFGWLLLLVQLQTFAPVYHLTIQLTNIIIKDMFPWILLYLTLSLGFASAIQLQFQLLPNATSCV